MNRLRTAIATIGLSTLLTLLNVAIALADSKPPIPR
jgi:hypothetical protein